MSKGTIPIVRISPFELTVDKVIHKISPLFQISHVEVILVKVAFLKFYFFRDPKTLEEIYTNKVCGLYKDANSLTWATWLMSNSVFNDDGFHWREKRIRAQAYFMPKCVPHLINTCLANSDFIIDTIQKENNQIWDAFKLCSLFSTDAGLNVLLGVEQRPELTRISELTLDAENGFTEILPLWIPTRKALRYRKTAKELREYFLSKGRAIRDRNAAPTESVGANVIDSLKLKLASKGDNNTFISELVGVYFGFTAIAVSATWVMYYLSMYREHRQKIFNELTLHGSSIFLEHCILETLRLKPAFWGFARYCTEATTISGISVPKGCNLVGMRYYSNRHPNYWDNPEQFNPDRFLEEHVNTREKNVYQNFGLGPRACVGRYLAIPLLTEIIKKIILNFNFEMVCPHPNTPTEFFDFGLIPKNFIIKLEKC